MKSAGRFVLLAAPAVILILLCMLRKFAKFDFVSMVRLQKIYRRSPAPLVHVAVSFNFTPYSVVMDNPGYPDLIPTPTPKRVKSWSHTKVTPGITRNEYALRRLKLLSVLRSSDHGGKFRNHAVILAASSLKYMSADIPYPFHQDTDFLYLSGLAEPDAVLILESVCSEVTVPVEKCEFKFILFVKPKDRKKEMWDGPVVGVEAAVDFFGADEAFPLSSLPSFLKDRYGNGDYCIWFDQKDSAYSGSSDAISNALKSKAFKKQALHGLSYYLQMVRLIKSDAEAALLEKSATVASRAFSAVMSSARPGMIENNLHALLEYKCRMFGAQSLSFPPVVAGGTRANTLHYINNTQVLRDGDLVLMDAGCEVNGYASDITRTWPISGRFLLPQKELYEIVVRVQETCLQRCQLGTSIEDLHHVMLTELGKELQEIDFIAANLSERELKKAAAEFCPHHVGHYLGMDIHDTPLIHKSLPLQPGMVITVEPGLYVPENAFDVPARYRGIGIRVEDDVLMTKNGPKVLTAALPKAVADIENLLAT